MQLLKSDVFGRVRRVGNVVVREADHARPWARALARHLMRREHRALSRLALGAGIDGIPRVARSRRHAAHAQLDRRRAHADREAARPRLLPRRLAPASPPARGQRDPQRSREGNQLAGDARGPSRPRRFPARDDARPGAAPSPARSATTTCATCSSTSAPIFPSALTAREKRILARHSLVSRIWMATGKKVYLFVTRRILRWRDREGAGDRDISSGT